MKSIMEEASSIAKAIEKGWTRAGKPKEFTVRIFEEPQKNFLHFTVKPAKVGIFFKEQAPVKETRAKEIKRLVEKRQTERDAVQGARAEKERQRVAKPPQPIKTDKWTAPMIQEAKGWFDMVLRRIDKAHVPYSLDAKKYSLIVQFSRPVLEDKKKEQLFFKSSSYLMLQALKRKFKRGLKGYKVVLISS